MSSIGLAMIVKDGAKTLDVCLQSVRGLFDQMVVVDTGSTDKTIDIARQHGAEVYPFNWIQDFSAARNFSFDKLTTDLAFWLDADDMFVGREYFEEMVQKLDEYHLDGMALEYLYSFPDVGLQTLSRLEPAILANAVPSSTSLDALKRQCNTTQWRERLVRRDPTWRWAYPIHEALPVAGRRLGRFDKIKIVHRRHLVGVASPARNLSILEAVPMERRDERIWFYFGMEYATAVPARLDDAIDAFKRYIPLSTIEDELFLAYHYLADLYRAKNQHMTAIEFDLKAVGLRPTWRDAYAGLLQSYTAIEAWGKAIYYGAMTKRAEIPDTPFAYNPMHEEVGWVGDYVKALVAVGEFEEALGESLRALAVVPDDPAFQHNVDMLSVQINVAKGRVVLSNAIEFFLRHDDAEAAAILIARVPAVYMNDPEIREWIRVCGSVCGPAARGVIVADTLKIPVGIPAADVPDSWQDSRMQYVSNHFSSRPHVRTVLQIGGPIETKQAWKDLGVHVERASKLAEICGEWDGIVLWNCLERVKQPEELVRLARTCLTPGGEILACVPNGPSTKGLSPPDVSRVRLRAFGVDTFRRVMGTVNMPVVSGMTTADSGELFLYDSLPIRGRSKSIAIVTVGSPEPWGPDSLKTGIGGSEEAVVRLSRAFARHGHTVRVYGAGYVGKDLGDPFGSIHYLPVEQYKPADVLLGWRHPELFLNQLRPLEAEWKALWLHDSITRDRVEAAAPLVDTVWCISSYHAGLYAGIPNVYAGRNGIDAHEFPAVGAIERQNARIVYVSTPFRGLDVLLNAFPAIRAKVPQAEVHCYYGWESADKMGATSTPEGAAFKAGVMELAKQPGVVWHGRVGQAELYKEVSSAGVWAYPTRWNEEHCISAYIAQACGAWPVVYPRGALGQSVVFGQKVQEDQFVQAVVEMINTNEGRTDMMNWIRANTTWDDVADRFERLWLGMPA